AVVRWPASAPPPRRRPPGPPPRRGRGHRTCAPGPPPPGRTPRGTPAPRRRRWRPAPTAWVRPTGGRSRPVDRLERPYLDRQGGGAGELARPLQRRVEVGHAD